jgi:hypothetical protein
MNSKPYNNQLLYLTTSTYSLKQNSKFKVQLAAFISAALASTLTPGSSHCLQLKHFSTKFTATRNNTKTSALMAAAGWDDITGNDITYTPPFQSIKYRGGYKIFARGRGKTMGFQGGKAPLAGVQRGQSSLLWGLRVRSSLEADRFL